MGNKGFTLIELLATIVLLGLAFGIASYGVVGMVEKSRMKSEGIFIEKLGDAIDEYIDMYGSGLVKGSEEYNFYKCHDTGSCDDASNGSYKVVANELDNITIRELIEKGFLVEEDLVNPANNKKCFEGKNPVIRVFKDSDFVYYYYVDLSGDNTCDISGENGVIDTLNENLKRVVDLE